MPSIYQLISHSPLFRNLARTLRIAQFCEQNHISTSQGLEQVAQLETRIAKWRVSRHEFIDYSSGKRGALLNPSKVQQEAMRFLGDLELVYPGASSAARNGDSLRVHLEQWNSKAQALGSYTCYKPGEFTTIAGNEGKPVGNLHFAGVRANSFYEWQGFMEGAALSEIQAANEILQDIRVKAL